MPPITNPVAADDFTAEASPAVARSNRVADIMMSTTFQLICALLIGVPLPDILRKTYENLPDSVMSYDNSMIGTVAAVLFGYLIYRKVTSLPGTNALLNQLPGFIVSYLAVAALFFALRLDFSRQQFVISFLLVSGFFWVLTFVAVRVRRTTFGFVSVGKAETLTKLDYVNWIRFNSPQDADKVPHIPLVADFNAGLSPDWERYIAEAAISGRRVFNAKQLKESLEGQVEIENLSENSFGHLAPDSIYAPIKLYIDILQAIAILALVWPIMLIVALAIKIDSKGPAIFSQKRMGFRGIPFTVYKFRSMNVAAPGSKDLPPGVLDITRAGDQRITRVGHFIRKTRLDELPQLFNVLKGEMSWIGPRPETLNLSEWYETEIPFYRYRHIVRPGISGWAQIKQGHVTSVDDVREKLEYDFYYVRNFSIWLDILIVIQTVRVILTGHGSK